MESLFALAGEVVDVEEELFDAATAVAGCMPGVLAALVLAFAEAGAEHGIAADVATRLAISRASTGRRPSSRGPVIPPRSSPPRRPPAA